MANNQEKQSVGKIDAICAAFECSLKADSSPQIEDFLPKIDPPIQPRLLRELLVLEICHREENGETLSRNEFHSRFPIHEQIIEDAFSKSSQSKTAKASVELDSTRLFQGDSQIGFSKSSSTGRFGDYELIEAIGQGGMGVVYKASQRSVGRIVALKLIRPERLQNKDDAERERYLQRFRNEATAAARIESDHIIRVYDVGEIADQPFYSMQFVKGDTLESKMEKGMTQREAALHVASVARAIHDAHQQGVLHRDLKPSNIMIEEESGRAMVADFGLAKLGGSAEMTMAGEVFGSPAYMSPEQAQDSAGVDARSDVYSLGATLYHALTGRLPFRGDDHFSILQKVMTAEAVPPRTHNPKLSRDLDTICLKCLRKSPSNRYQTALELAEDLERHLENRPIRARRISVWARMGKWTQRHPAFSMILAFLILLPLFFAAQKLWEPALLDLTIVPPDAVLRINGKPVELSEGRVQLELPPESVTISVSAPGYVGHEETVQLRRGLDDAVVKSIELASASGYLEVNTKPDFAQVILSDESGNVIAKGLTPFVSPLIESGPCMLSVSREFCLPIHRRVMIPSQEQVNVLPTISLTVREESKSLQRLTQISNYLTQSISKPINVKNMPLSELMGLLGEQEGVPISIDDQSLLREGVAPDEPISVDFSRGSIRLFFQQVLAPKGLAFYPRGNGESFHVVISTRIDSEEQFESVIYPVSDLGDVGSLIRIIYHNTRGPWIDTDGTGGTINPIQVGQQNALQLKAQWHVLVETHELLRDIRAVTGKTSDLDGTARSQASYFKLRDVIDRMNQPIKNSRSFRNVPLNNVLQWLSNSESIPIAIDEYAIRRERINVQNMTVKLEAGTTVAEALRLILENRGLAWHPEDVLESMALVVTAKVFNSQAYARVFYPLKLPEAKPVEQRAFVRRLTEFIQDIREVSWVDRDGTGGMISFVEPNILGVRQSWEGHFKIYQIVQNLDRGQQLFDAETPMDSQKAGHKKWIPEMSPIPPEQAIVDLRERTEQAAHLKSHPDLDSLRRDLADFQTQHGGKPPALEAARLARRLYWPVDGLASNITPQLIEESGFDPEEPPQQIKRILGDPRLKHWSSVYDLARSPNGKWLASASQDRTVKIWDTETGKLIRTLRGHGYNVRTVAFVSDRQLVSATGDGRIFVWSTQNWQRTHLLRGHSKTISGMAVFWETVVSGSEDGTLRFWNLETGDPIGQPIDLRSPVNAVAASPDGSLLAAGTSDGLVRVWEFKELEKNPINPTHQFHLPALQPVKAVAISRDNQHIAAFGNGAHPGLIWDARSKKERRFPMKSYQKNGFVTSMDVRDTVFSKEGNRVLLVGWNFPPIIWNLKKPQEEIEILPAGVSLGKGSVVWDSDDQEIAIGNSGFNIALFRGGLWKSFGKPPQKSTARYLNLMLTRGNGHDAFVFDVTVNPSGEFLAASSADKRVSVWDLSTGIMTSLTSSGHYKFQIDFGPKYGLLLPGRSSLSPQLWDAREKKDYALSPRVVGCVDALTYSRTGRYFASVNSRNTILIWDPDLGEVKQELPQQSGVARLAFSPDDSLLAVGGDKGTIRLWNPETGQWQRNLPGHTKEITSLEFSPDGNVLLSSSWDSNIRSVDVANGSTIFSVKTRYYPMSARFSPDGEIVATIDQSGSLVIRDVKTGEAEKTIRVAPTPSANFDIEFTPDGRHIVHANANGTISIIELTKWRPDL